MPGAWNALWCHWGWVGRDETPSCLPFWVCLCRLAIPAASILSPTPPRSANCRAYVRAREGQCEGLGLKNSPALNPETSGRVIWADELCLVRAPSSGGRGLCLLGGRSLAAGWFGAQAPRCPSFSSESHIPRGPRLCGGSFTPGWEVQKLKPTCSPPAAPPSFLRA